MNLTRKTWTCISVLIVAAALFLIMAEASFAEASAVGFGDTTPYDTEITLKENETAEVKLDRNLAYTFNNVVAAEGSGEFIEGTCETIEGKNHFYVTAKKEGVAKVNVTYFETSQSSSQKEVELTVNVLKLRNYNLTYVDNGKVELDTDSIRSAFLNYFDKKDYYYEGEQAVTVAKGADGWQININNLGHALTYEDVLGENGILESIYTGEIKEQKKLIGFGTKSAATEYKTEEAFEEDRNNKAEITDGAKFYLLTSVRLSSADIIVKAPLCGEKVTYDKEYIPTGAHPQVDVPEDALYSVDDFKDETYWCAFTDEGGVPTLKTLPADTVLKGDTEYVAFFGVKPCFGYYFDDFTKVTVNGGGILFKKLYDTDGAFEVYGTVTAEHDWDSGKVTTKPTLKKTGVKTFACKACGEKKTSTIAKLKVNTLSAKGKTVKIKLAKLKKTRTIDRKKAISVAKAVGTVTYKKTKGNNKITVNKKTGKITVKKGLKKGKYTVKVTVYAKGNATYGAAAKKVKVTIKVVK